MTLAEIKNHLSRPGARWRTARYRHTVLEVTDVRERGVVAGIVDASGSVTHKCFFEWAMYFSDHSIQPQIELI